MPLAETYALKGLAARGRAYGPVRLWGSAAFMLGTFVAGFATDIDLGALSDLADRRGRWADGARGAHAGAGAASVPPSAKPATPRRHLLRDPAFVAVLAAASLIQASHAVYYGFSALQWRALGLDGTAIAALWALGVIAEIVLFARVRARLPPFFPPITLLMIGALGGAVRWAAMALEPAGRGAAGFATAARGLVRRHPSRRARLCRAPGAARAGRDRARASRHRGRHRDGGGDRVVRRAVRSLRQPSPTRRWR